MNQIQITILREAIALGEFASQKYASQDLAQQMALLRTYDTRDEYAPLVLQDLEILASNIYALDPQIHPFFSAIESIFRSTL